MRDNKITTLRKSLYAQFAPSTVGLIAITSAALLALSLCGCPSNTKIGSSSESTSQVSGQQEADANAPKAAEIAQSAIAKISDHKGIAKKLRRSLDISEDYHDVFVHGNKPARYQKYIVLHDTESEKDATSVVGDWISQNMGVAAHFIINKDGSVLQCVPINKIAHHAGFGDVGHNKLYGVEDESRDDRKLTETIGAEFPDYGMNSWSIGIEMVHTGKSGSYPQAQLEALDTLIAYIDVYYGFESKIIDHKAWRSDNSDTSPEFAPYLANYQQTRTHTPA